jgi:hypothetical protein
MVGENQPPCGIRTPRFHSSLKRPDLSIGELSGILVVKEFHELRGISRRWCMNRRVDSVNHPDLDCPMAEWATFSA